MGRIDYLHDPAVPKPNTLVPACGMLAVDDQGRCYCNDGAILGSGSSPWPIWNSARVPPSAPCVMSAWLTVGNVHDAPLAAILSGDALARATATIPQQAAGPCEPGVKCQPDAYPCYPENE